MYHIILDSFVWEKKSRRESLRGYGKVGVTFCAWETAMGPLEGNKLTQRTT
jgi:hypothetical protein